MSPIPGITLSLLISFVSLSIGAAAGQTTASPKPLTLQNNALRVTVDPAEGRITVLDKRTGYTWRQAENGPVFESLEQPGPGQIRFRADFGGTAGKPNTFLVSLELPPKSAELLIETRAADPNQPLDWAWFLPPLLLDTPDGVLAVADYGDGHLYPLNLNPMPRTWFDGDRLDMPWVGLCDHKLGYGYELILDTCDDAAIECKSIKTDKGSFAAPRVAWKPSKGKLAYPRRLRYVFTAKGGYVSLAKVYRDYARKQGLLVTLAQKAKRNPNLKKLYGAPDLWSFSYPSHLAFIKEARAAGVDRLLLNGRPTPEEHKQINAMGYLTGEYDNYTDVQPAKSPEEIDNSHEILPDHAVMTADKQRMKAWLTMEGLQYMKRCPSFWVPSAKLVIPKLLRTSPFNTRFIDVTTAESLYECYDPNHPLTRAEKRQCGVDLLAYVESQGLVVGGEHGIWWGVPHLNYIEGMMSGGYASWPAGYLLHPKTKDDSQAFPDGGKPGPWKDYAQWGIGHEWRAPLWELVFHDCVVSTWYWGDASDWLLQAAPEITAKKDAFNVLYGTIPLLWSDKEGSWQANRKAFMRTFRVTSYLHRAIAEQELISHEFVTPDHAVQRTRFTDGTIVIVNFGEKPAQVSLSGKSYLLPQNGFAVRGPKIEQSLQVLDGKELITIKSGDYHYSSSTDKE